MPLRVWMYVIGIALICAVAGGAWYRYQGNCHGVDDCAARTAEGHERDTPPEPR